MLTRETMSSRILLIDDDAQLGALLQELFSSKGYAMELAYDGEDGAARATQGAYDLIILDVMLPKKDGLAVLSEVRQSSDIPVLMLTAKGEHTDRIKGLERGADDYLAKPFNPRELMLRVGAILRRGSWSESAEQDTLTVGPLELQIRRLEASVGQRLITLTGTEERVLEELMRNPGKVQSRESLTERALGRPRVAYDRAIDTHISHLRKKLGRDHLKRPVIRCIRGMGYLLVTDWRPDNP